MAKRDMTEVLTTKANIETTGAIQSDAITLAEPAQKPLGQRKLPEKGQFCLQVDRQTKSSYTTYEAAEHAALVIKRAYPVVRVAIYDTVECVNKVIELPS